MSSSQGFVLAQVDESEVVEDEDLGEIIAEEVQADLDAAADETGMPQLEVGDFAPQLVWLAIAFVTLYLLMARVALPRIATVIEGRRDRIANDLDTAARLRQETDEVIAAYEQQLAEAREKAQRITGEARDKLKSELEDERARVDAELGDKTAEAEKEIAGSRDSALAEINAVAGEAAGDIVEALIGKKPTAKEVDAALAAVKSE